MIAVISDTHNHNWSVFSTVLKSKKNSRLQDILDETWRAATLAKSKGASQLIHCGDLFHVRGSVSPSVLNPTIDMYDAIVNRLGLPVTLIAGNHDLESNESHSLGNSGQALSKVGVNVITDPAKNATDKHIYLPYIHDSNALREVITELAKQVQDDIAQWTLFLHAPLNDVIMGIPNSGLCASELKKYGFKAVFCGHYHHHKIFNGNICSVGALTHQTFSDVDAKAGFLLFDDQITHYPSNAPRFVDFQPDWDDIEEVEHITGNFVRVRLENANNQDVTDMRNYLNEKGASGISIIHVPKVVSERKGSIEAGSSVRVSISQWAKEQGYSESVIIKAQKIIEDVEAKDLL